MIKKIGNRKKKENNNLVLVNVGKKKYYFTSSNRAAIFLGIQSNTVNCAILKNKVLTNTKDEKVTIEICDGSEIPYKYINEE